MCLHIAGVAAVTRETFPYVRNQFMNAAKAIRIVRAPLSALGLTPEEEIVCPRKSVNGAKLGRGGGEF